MAVDASYAIFGVIIGLLLILIHPSIKKFPINIQVRSLKYQGGGGVLIIILSLLYLFGLFS